MKKFLIGLVLLLCCPYIIGTFTSGDIAYEDLRVAILTTRVGGNAPTLETFTDTLKAMRFADNDEVHFSVQMPHSWAEGTTIWPHVHFCAEGDGSGKNTELGLEYSWQNIDGTFPSSTDIKSGDEALSTALDHLFADLSSTGISGTGKMISSVLVCRLYRDAASADNYTGNVFITDFDVHYLRNSAGSKTLITK